MKSLNWTWVLSTHKVSWSITGCHPLTSHSGNRSSKWKSHCVGYPPKNLESVASSQLHNSMLSSSVHFDKKDPWIQTLVDVVHLNSMSSL
jgi:hypothetical protein